MSRTQLSRRVSLKTPERRFLYSQVYKEADFQCFLYRPDYFFSFTENAYEVSVVASESTIDHDFLPFLTGTEDAGTSSDIYRVLQVDDEGGQGISILKNM